MNPFECIKKLPFKKVFLLYPWSNAYSHPVSHLVPNKTYKDTLYTSLKLQAGIHHELNRLYLVFKIEFDHIVFFNLELVRNYHFEKSFKWDFLMIAAMAEVIHWPFKNIEFHFKSIFNKHVVVHSMHFQIYEVTTGQFVVGLFPKTF